MKSIASGRSSVAASRASRSTAHHIDQRRPQVVRHDIGEALDLVVGPRQVGSALVDARLEPGIERGDFVARGGEFAGVDDNGKRRPTHHHHDHHGADDRHPAQPGGARLLVGDGGSETVVGVADNAQQEGLRLVHQGLALVGVYDRRRVGILACALEGERLVHFGEFLRHCLLQSIDRLLVRRVGRQLLLQRLELLQGARLGPVIGRGIALIAGDQEAALAAFGGLQRIPQIARRSARVTRLQDVVEIGLAAFPQPDRRPHDRQQRHEGDDQQDHGGLDEAATGDRHDRSCMPEFENRRYMLLYSRLLWSGACCVDADFACGALAATQCYFKRLSRDRPPASISALTRCRCGTGPSSAACRVRCFAEANERSRRVTPWVVLAQK